jgi:hypothetical protein
MINVSGLGRLRRGRQTRIGVSLIEIKEKLISVLFSGRIDDDVRVSRLTNEMISSVNCKLFLFDILIRLFGVYSSKTVKHTKIRIFRISNDGQTSSKLMNI